MNTSQLLEIGLIALFGLFMLVLIVATISGIVHAIRESVRRRRRPPILSIVLWVVSALLFILLAVLKSISSGANISLYLFGVMHDVLDRIIVAGAVLTMTVATCYYVFLSFLPPRSEAIQKTHRATRQVDADDEEEEDEDEDEEDREEARHMRQVRAATEQRNFICRILTVAVAVVLNAIVIGLMVLLYSVFHYEHNITELQSPDDQRIIYVDNATLHMNGIFQAVAPRVFVYEKIAPGIIVLLDWEPGTYEQSQPTRLEASEDMVIWRGDRIRFQYGNTYVDYVYYGVEADSEE